MSNSEEIPGRIDELTGSEIAVIGMACRFPGAETVDAYWQRLRDGVESITFLGADEIERSMIDPADPAEPNYIKAASILEGVDLFDASFFGFTPREAEVMDPQHRLFLECAWETLEHAGYNPETYKAAIGVFAGARTNTYIFNLFSNGDKLASLGAFEIGLGNDLAFLPTRVSYKLNLRGPSYAVHTACSTSLIAIHLACQSLLIDECQMALAGGIAVNVPQRTGYLYTRGGIVSPDGHCRAFDAEAQGTLFGSGVGIVLLKRLEDALADGDTIHAVIKGTAANNDGSAKASFTAPSSNGQSSVIAEALANAGVDPNTISYVETHGTGTALGDPIEVHGLTKAFKHNGGPRNYCALGSVKSNLGHLDAAAGIASFIKTTLALKHKTLPASLHFNSPNPNIDFADSPFYVNAQTSQWKADRWPRRAGVSAFGVGGTNAHVVLEEAPSAEDSGPSRPCQLLTISAKSLAALDAATINLLNFFKSDPAVNIADTAYTLKVGRKPFSHRRAIICRDTGDAIEALETLNAQRVFMSFQESSDQPVVFMFPGGGAQYANMGRDLYDSEPFFRAQVDECCDLLKRELGYDLLECLYPPPNRVEQASRKLKQTSIALPALFVIEYSLARLWMNWGIRPEAMIGHSLGEYVAACLAGVFSLQDALSLVVLRGRLFEELPRGSMISVSLPEKEAAALAGDRLSIAAINARDQCVLSGPTDAIEELAASLSEKGVEFRHIHIEVAAHSMMVAPILEKFESFVANLKLNAPVAPFISNVTGKWITADEATDARYWAKHLRQTVRFADGLRELMKESSRVLLEVGPGQTLSTLAKMQQDYAPGRVVLNSLRHAIEQQSDNAFILTTLAKLWLAGVEVNWSNFYKDESRHRIPLPTYPFERHSYWIEPKAQASPASGRQTSLGKNPDVSEWFYIPSWKRSRLPQPSAREVGQSNERCWLVFANEAGPDHQLICALKQRGHRVISVKIGENMEKAADDQYSINPADKNDYVALIKAMKSAETLPHDILHLWSAAPDGNAKSEAELFNQAQHRGFYSLLFLSQALSENDVTRPLNLWVVTSGLHEVEGQDVSIPEKATILGPCKVIPQENQNVKTCCIDVVMSESGAASERRVVDQLLREVLSDSFDPLIAYRGKRRWAQTFEPVRLDNSAGEFRSFRDKGVYLITGGLGGVGLLLSDYLARSVQARLVLVGRSAFPEREAWDEWLAAHDEDDDTSRRIIKIRAMEDNGAEVMVASADVASHEQMRALITKVYDRFGALNAVIHAAGVTSGSSVFNPIVGIGPDEAAAQFQPKVLGVYVLEKLLKGKDLDFIMMTSSNSSVLGGMGFVAYSAANAFMDAFASSSSRTDGPLWISSSWDPWPEETKKYTGVQTSMDKYAMTSQESVEAFKRAVTQVEDGHVVVATGDLTERLSLWIKRDYSALAAADAHPRPDIQSAYVSPENEAEEIIANVWQQLLGLERVGTQDNFFDLGGHSLLATRLVARLREQFQIDFPLQSFFAAPTVAGLAREITKIQAEAENKEKTELLEMLAHLSDEEVEIEITRRMNQARQS